MAARCAVVLDDAAIGTAVATRQPVVLLFENGHPALPIVIGHVQPDPNAALLGQLLHKGAAAPAPAAAPKLEARLDGKRVVVEAKDEVVLKCGEASVTLKRDGKLILRGAYIETT
jgi:hypothetical protein